MTRTICALALTTLAFAATDAAAQPAAGPAPAPAVVPEQQVRQGLLIGFGVGGGNISAECDADVADICDEVLESGSVSFQIGAMVTPRLGVMLDVWPMVYHEDFLTITHVISTGAAQYWVTPQLWLKGGIGVARAQFEYDGIFVDATDETDTVAGIMGAVGFELYHRPNFAIDVQLRGGTGFYDQDEVKGHNAAVQAGFTWF